MGRRYKRYRKDFPHGYATGIFPVLELLRGRPGDVECVLLHPAATGSEGAEKVRAACAVAGVPAEEDGRLVELLSAKGNAYAVGVFRKYEGALDGGRSHLVLVQPAGAGNLGAVARTALAFGFRDLAVVRPAVDHWHPEAVRASMGALFHLEVGVFDGFVAYREAFPGRPLIALHPGAAENLGAAPLPRPCSLLFGSEGAGLDESVLAACRPLRIAHSGEVDSLNLAVAVGVALYELTRERGESGGRT